jgi:hypothetical protein
MQVPRRTETLVLAGAHTPVARSKYPYFLRYAGMAPSPTLSPSSADFSIITRAPIWLATGVRGGNRVKTKGALGFANSVSSSRGARQAAPAPFDALLAWNTGIQPTKVLDDMAAAQRHGLAGSHQCVDAGADDRRDDGHDPSGGPGCQARMPGRQAAPGHEWRRACRRTACDRICWRGHMKLDFDERGTGFDWDGLLVAAALPDPGWRCRPEAAPVPVAPKLRDAILSLPRDHALRHAYLRKRWSRAAWE